MVFVADDAEVVRALGQFKQDLLLDEVGVLVLVHHHELDAAGDAGGDFGFLEKVVQVLLEVGEVNAVLFRQGIGVGQVGGADGVKELVGGVGEPARVNEFFRNLVEVIASAFDGRPFGAPTLKESATGSFANDGVEIVEQEEELGEFVEGLVVTSERRAVTMLGEKLVAQAVDGGDAKCREVPVVAGLLSRRRDTVAELERGFFRERANDELTGPGEALVEDVDRAENQTEGLAGARPSDHEEGVVGVRNNRALRVVHLGKGCEDRGRDVQSSPSFRKLKTASGETIR